jgi:hypothetical protein
MEQESSSMRDRLLARLPQPENLAAYREETASLLAKHEKALSTEHWTNMVLALCALAVYMMANSIWGLEHNSTWLLKLDQTHTVVFDVVAGILFFLATVNRLQEFIYRNQVSILKEVKQVQLQVLELQASLRKSGDE